MDTKKFVVTPKNEKDVTITIRIPNHINNILENLSSKSNHSRNELINMALKFALDNLFFTKDKE